MAEEGQEEKHLDESLIMELREAFDLYDKDEDGLINMNELAEIIIILGKEPPDIRDLKKLWKEADPDNIGTIDFDQFLRAVTNNFSFELTEDDVIEAFKFFDKEEKGHILAEELKYILTNFGDKLTDKEANDFVKEADFAWTGKIDYAEFARTMMKR